MARFPKPSSAVSQFLKADHVGKVGTTVKAQLAGNAHVVDSQFAESGEQVVVDVKIGKTLYALGLDPDKPNYRILVDEFGTPDKWTKGAFTVKVAKGPNGAYIAVQV